MAERLTAVAIALVALATAAVATADRRATHSERRAIANAIELPTKCTKARISTVDDRWAAASWKPRPKDKCMPYASNGVVVLNHKVSRWRIVTEGSSFNCSYLYRHVPRAVAQDLRIDC